MDQHQHCRQLKCFLRKTVQLHGERHGENHAQAAQSADEIRKLHHFLCVIFRLLEIACTHATADHCDHSQIHGLSRKYPHSIQIVGDCVGRDLCRAKQGDDADDQYASQLEDAVLDSARNPDMKDLSNHSAVPVKPSEADMNLQPRIMQADNQNDTRRQYQINQRVVHHVIRDPAVQKPQKSVPEQNRPHHDHNGDKPRDHHQLIRCLTRPLPVFLSQKL